MTRYPVSSSHIAAVGYDEADSVLEIEFADGAVYRYEGVAKTTYTQLIHAPSVGRYFHQRIRDHYDSERL